MLIRMRRDNASFAEIAAALNRSVPSVLNRASSLRSTIVDHAGIIMPAPVQYRHTNLTALVCGDPPPGRSALDQRGGRI